MLADDEGIVIDSLKFIIEKLDPNSTYVIEGNTLEVIKGIVDGDVYDFNQLKQLSVLPSYETLLTQLAAGMLGTLSQLSIGLNMLVEKGQEA